MDVAARLRLDSDWSTAEGRPGVLTISLRNLGDRPVHDFLLAFTSLFRAAPDAEVDGGRLVRQISNHHVVTPPEGLVLEPGASWSLSVRDLSHAFRHYTDGLKSAYLVASGDVILPVAVTPTTLDGRQGRPRPAAAARPSGTAASSVSVLPYPVSLDLSGRRDPALPFVLSGGPPESRAAFAAARGLGQKLFPDAPPLLADGDGVACAARFDGGLDGGHRLVFAPGGVTVSAASREGFLHGFVTLGQMLRGARLAPESFPLPADGEIVDRPRFGWRGVMLDVARQMHGIGEIARLADQAAWLKLNRLHLHLTDDEGWRLDVPGYPDVAARAAWRGHGLAVPPLLGSSADPYGGVYARSDLVELARHAGEIGVTVVPEIDIPGHCYCVLETVPGLRDPRETGSYRSIQSFPNNALNPAMPATYAFLERVFAEVADIFPSPWIHVGGDEVADDAWLGSPLALALMKERGWRRVDQLQSHLLRRAQAIVRDLGRGVGAWQEAAAGGGIAADGAYLVAWRDAASGPALARQGHDVVMAPAQHCYLDMAQSGDWWEPGGSWAGTVTPEASYDYDPGGGWPDMLKHRLVGVQACLWSENLHERRLLDHMLFPRLGALAEAAWIPADRKDFRRFLAIHPLVLPAGGRRPAVR